MDDLIERLRDYITSTEDLPAPINYKADHELIREAADALAQCHLQREYDLEQMDRDEEQIEALRAEVERLRSLDASDQIVNSKSDMAKQIAWAGREIERLRGALEPLIQEILVRKPYRRMELYRLSVIARAALRDQLVDTNKMIGAEREAIAQMVEQSEVFCEHGCTDRLAAAIRAMPSERQSPEKPPQEPESE